LLIHQDEVQHYRVSIYSYLSDYLKPYGFELTVASQGIETNDLRKEIHFNFTQGKLCLPNIIRLLDTLRPDIVILFVNPKNLYLFPLLFYLKLKGIRMVYWGHGIDLGHISSPKIYLNKLEHWIVDAIILYAGHLKEHIGRKLHYKVFIANNTLNTDAYKPNKVTGDYLLQKYGIQTKKNIVFMGRIQKRKRLHDLIAAHSMLNRNDVGLIIAGPDTESLLPEIKSGKNQFILGPVYGPDAMDLLSACDVYCLPGHMGLSIVDAFYCGLPVVTENVPHAPEIMYLKNGINGFMVEKGDVKGLAEKIGLLLDDFALRQKFSKAAKDSIQKEAHIDRLCEGFLAALQFVGCAAN